MKIKAIRFLYLITILCTPLSSHANWSDQGRYIIKTGLIALGTMITYEKFKTWWSPSTPLNCDTLIELTSQNAECATKLKNIFDTHFQQEIESTKAIKVSYIQEMQSFLGELESYKKSVEQCCEKLSSYKKSAEQCRQEFQKYKEVSQDTHHQLQEYIQQFESFKTEKQELQARFIALIKDTADLRQITGIGVMYNGRQYSLTYDLTRLDGNVVNLSNKSTTFESKLKALEEQVKQLQDTLLNTQ